jgi:hypothetical protein
MKTKILLIAPLLFLLCKTDVKAQNTFPSTGAAGIGTTTPNTSSLLEIKSTSKGVLIPRMTLVQRNAIPVATSTTGLLIYQTNNTPGFYYYSGTAWTPISGANPALSNLKSPTAINVDLLPGLNDSINLGSALLRYKDVNLFNLKFADGSVQTTAFTPYSAGTGISISGNTIKNTNPDKVVVLTSGTGISVTGTYPNFTVTNSNPSQWTKSGKNIAYSGGDVLVHGATVGLGGGAVPGNTAVGIAALGANTTGSGNVAIGNSALAKNTTGFQQVAIGDSALYNNIVDPANDYSNVAVGYTSLFSNTTGDNNTGLGWGALHANTTASNNTALGNAALWTNTTGSSNTAAGNWAMEYNTTGTGNSAFGEESLPLNTTGSYNSANGFLALDRNTTGSNNTANGFASMYWNSSGNFNAAFGSEPLNNNTSGNENNAFGHRTLFYNTTGNSNVAIGNWALFTNTTSSNLVAVGDSALYNNTAGTLNVAVGSKALFENTIGLANTANGSHALYSNTTGYYNTANGYYALYHNTTGNYNTANGSEALYSNTGIDNTANGYGALYSNTTGSGNTGSGFDALGFNTTGYNNTANGFEALLSNTTGIENTANGLNALYSNTTGNYNTGLGFNTLENTTVAFYNTAVGYAAGASYDNGYNNVFVGANTDVNGAGYYNDIAIGQGTICTEVSQAIIGNSATTSIGGYVNWSNISDGRVKKNIKQNVPGLAFINKLQPVTYNLDLDAIDKIVQYVRKDSTGKAVPYNKAEQTARLAKEKIVYTGFVAQDVEKVAKGLNYDFSGVDAAKNNKDLYGLRYGDFVVPLVKAVQELSKLNDDKNIAIDSLKQQNAGLQHQMNDLKALVLQIQQQQQSCACSASVNSGAAQQYNVALSNAASLEQNIPNPFTNTTTIGCTLPQKFSSAQITIADKNGKVLKQLTLSGAGKGSVHVDAAMMSSGAYSYALYVDGKLIDSKQMILTK